MKIIINWGNGKWIIDMNNGNNDKNNVLKVCGKIVISLAYGLCWP